MRPSDNPFASRRIDTLGFRFQRSSLDGVISGLAANRGRGAVVGQHGAGKTTLFDALAGHLEGEVVRIRLGTDTKRPFESAVRSLPPLIVPHHAVLLDGAEQLDWWSWRRILDKLRAAGTLVITSHKPGRLPTVYTCQTDPALLRNLVSELAPEIVEKFDLDDLFHRHAGNIRDCFRELYDLCAQHGV